MNPVKSNDYNYVIQTYGIVNFEMKNSTLEGNLAINAEFEEKLSSLLIFQKVSFSNFSNCVIQTINGKLSIENSIF
jgi:hypothetical protein